MKSILLVIPLFLSQSLYVTCENSEKCVKEKITYVIKRITEDYKEVGETVESEVISNNEKEGYYFNITKPVKILCKGSLNITVKVAHFWLDNQGLEHIEPGTFDDQNLYEQLRISSNKLTTIKKGTFKDLAIKSLDLSNNELKTIEQGAIENLPNLDTLTLRNNSLTVFDPNTVINTPNLRWFDISFNKLRILDEMMFKSFSKKNVLGLGLANNEIESLPGKIFEGFSVFTLNLENNKLSDISNEIYYSLKDISELNLSNNKLKTLKDGFYELSTLNYCYMIKNDFDCDTFKKLKIYKEEKGFKDKAPKIISELDYHFSFITARKVMTIDDKKC